jgi:hypothetical protein
MSSSIQFIIENPGAESAENGICDDACLRAILNILRARKVSLRTFLLAAFASKNSDVKAKVSRFYSDDGPARVVKRWSDVLKRTDNDYGFTMAITDSLVSRVRTELNRFSDDNDLRHPANGVTHESIASFTLEHVEEQMELLAPHLTRTLKGFASDDGMPTDEQHRFVATTGSMLLFLKSQQSNYLQMAMGVYLFSQGCSKSVMNVLSHVGLSVSYTSVHVTLKSLTEDALRNVRSAIKDNRWFLIYDNINMPNRKYDQRIDNKDTFENGTTATVVITNDLNKTLPVHNHHAAPRLRDLMFDEKNKMHFRDVSRFHLVDVLRRHYSAYQRACVVTIPAIKRLKVERTTAYPLPAMAIDQSSIEGNLEIIQTIMKSTLKLNEDAFTDDLTIIMAGDQLTVSRIRSVQYFRKGDITPYHRLRWAVPVMQLFHLQMLLCFTILRTYRGQVSTPGSLAYFIDMLRRKRLGKDSTDYHAADELLKHTFDAMIRRVWQVELGTDDFDDYASKKTPDYRLRAVMLLKSEKIREKYLTNSDELKQRFTTDANCNYASVNAALFIRDMIFYLELCTAIKFGDVGRIMEALQPINVMFQAGYTKNYAIELMRIMYGIRHGWSSEMTDAILSSWLVNTKGENNSWLPSDLYQEHNNLLTKTIYSAKGSNMSWQSIAQSISTNIHTFSKVSSQMEAEYSTPYNNHYHSEVNAEMDIRAIQRSLKEHNILGGDPLPTTRAVQPVNDLIKEGFKKLVGGRFTNFIQIMRDENSHEGDINDDVSAS